MPIRRPNENDPDWMAKKQDKELIYLEQRISALYEEASHDITEEYERFWESYQLEYDNRLAMVESGEITEDSFQRWCRNQIFQSNRYQAMIRMLTDVLVNADVAAMAAVNEQLPFTLAESYDFISSLGFEAADRAGITVGTFQIYNAESVQAIIRDNPDLLPSVDLPEDELWNRNHINREITQAIIQGDTMPQIAQRLQRVAQMDNNAAIRNARTSMTAAENLGRTESASRLRQRGVPITEIWSATKDSRTRDSHLLLDGTTRDEKTGKFGVGIIEKPYLRFPADPEGQAKEIYNCRCRLNVNLLGIDHSHDDEIYERFMQENYPEDWARIQQKRADITTGEGRREQERLGAIERQRRLREERQANQQALSKVSGMNISGADAVNRDMANMNATEQASWAGAIDQANYTVIDESRLTREGRMEYYDPSTGEVTLFNDTDEHIFFHETAHSMDNGSVDISFRTFVRYADADIPPVSSDYTYRGNASGAAQAIYDVIPNAWQDDNEALMRFAGIENLDMNMDNYRAIRRAISGFRDTYGESAASNLSDMIDAQTEGRFPLVFSDGGHGAEYWNSNAVGRFREAFAEISDMRATGNGEAVEAIREVLPNMVSSTDTMYGIVFGGDSAYENTNVTDRGVKILEQILIIRRADSV